MWDEAFAQAVQAIRSGDVRQGQRLLWQYLQNKPQDVKAWLWLAQSLPDNERRLRAMEECLKYNPQSEIALRAVQQLTRQKKLTEIDLDEKKQPDRIEETSVQQLHSQSPVQESLIVSEQASEERTVAEPIQENTSKAVLVSGEKATKIEREPGVEIEQPEAWFEDDSQEKESAPSIRPVKIRYKPSIWVWMAVILLVVLLGMVIFVLIKFYLPYYLWRSGALSMMPEVSFIFLFS